MHVSLGSLAVFASVFHNNTCHLCPAFSPKNDADAMLADVVLTFNWNEDGIL
ncbi:hypothetical protein CGRA01v4_07385 [Colletotrichum graminicola]|nr:hypothetical protein CGRA01v4_07385 [Colletotrichum graminicola]